MCIRDSVYTFNTLGTYNVKLTVTSDANCVSTITKPITVRPLPVPNLTYNPPFGPPPLPVNFFNTSTGATSYSWTFGDGATSTQPSPQHTYADTGYYCFSM